MSEKRARVPLVPIGRLFVDIGLTPLRIGHQGQACLKFRPGNHRLGIVRIESFGSLTSPPLQDEPE